MWAFLAVFMRLFLSVHIDIGVISYRPRLRNISWYKFWPYRPALVCLHNNNVLKMGTVRIQTTKLSKILKTLYLWIEVYCKFSTVYSALCCLCGVQLYIWLEDQHQEGIFQIHLYLSTYCVFPRHWFCGESFTDEPNRILSNLAESMQGSWAGTRAGLVMWASLACQGAEVAWCPSRCPALAGTEEIAKTHYVHVLSLMSDGMSHARTAHSVTRCLFVLLKYLR